MISRDQEHHPASEQATFQEEEIRVLVEQELSHQKDHCKASQELNNSTTPDQPIIQSTRDRALTNPPSDLQANVIQASPTTIDEPIQ
jgi:predicted metal-dependent hydrolase